MHTRVCYGGDCPGDPTEEQPCKLESACPKVQIPITLKLPCELFTENVQEEFARGISLVVGVAAADVTLDVPPCSEEEEDKYDQEDNEDDGRRRRRRLHAARRLGEGDEELTFVALVSLDAVETKDLGGMDAETGAVAKIQEMFSGDFGAQLKTVASQVDSSSWDDKYDPEDVFAAAVVDVDAIADVNSEGYGADQDNTMKGILFLTFVVCLTLFVVVVLAIVVWLEYNKCKARDPYTNLEQ